MPLTCLAPHNREEEEEDALCPQEIIPQAAGRAEAEAACTQLSQE